MSSQFQRLIWKEYRVQRALVVLLAICLIVLQVLAFWLESSRNSGGLTLVVIFGLCFSATSAAIGFAGEEDQGTAIWLRQLPVSTWTLFWSKLLTTLAGTFALISIGALSLGFLRIFGGAELAETADDAGIWSMVTLALLLTSLFWSLQSRNVFAPIGLAVASVLGLLLGQELLNQNPFSSVITGCVVGLMFLMLFPLAKRWHRGPRNRMRRMNALARPGSRVRRLFDRQNSLKPYLRLVAVYLAIPVAISAVLVAVLTGLHVAWPFAFCLLLVCFWLLFMGFRRLLHMPSIRSTWLARAASAPTERRRTAAVLLWKECQFAIPAGLTAIGVGVAAVLTRVFVLDDQPWPAIVLLFVSVEFGLRTFRHDQQKFHGMFWSHRGVSPLVVLGIRNIVWLCTLLVVALAILLIESPLTSRLRIIDVLNDRSMNGGVSFAMTWLVGGFLIGQLSSCWIRKQLLAFFVAGCAFTAYTMGLVHYRTSDVPLVLTAWPIILLVAVGLAMSRRQWMDRRFSLSIALKRAAFLLIPLLCLWPVKAAWRMAQIPRIGPAMTPGEFVGEATRAAAVPSDENQHSDWANHWKTLEDATSSINSARMAIGDVARAPHLKPTQLTRAINAIDHIVADCHQHHLPPMVKHPWAVYPSQPMVLAVLQKVDELSDAGEPFKAMRQLELGIRLIRFLQNEATSWNQWHRATHLERCLLQHMHHVAADDRLTAVQLELAANSIVRLLENPVSIGRLLNNRDAVYAHLLNRPAFHAYVGIYEPHIDKFHFPHDLLNAGFAERRRFMSLMSQSNGWTMQHPAAPDSRTILRWSATTHWDGTDLFEDPVFHEAKLQRTWLGTNRFVLMDVPLRGLLNAERATWVILNLQIYRRQHGEFPDDLETLRDDFKVDTTAEEHQAFIDVVANVPFQYSRTGTGDSFFTCSAANTTLITDRQPVIWCSWAVPRNRRAIKLDQSGLEKQLQTSDRAVLPNANRIVWLDESREVPPLGGIGGWKLKPDSRVIELSGDEGSGMRLNDE